MIAINMAEDGDSEDGYSNFTRNSSSNASIRSRSSRRSRGKKVIALSGPVSNMSGKDCVSCSNKNESAVFEKVQAWEAMTDLAEPSSMLSESGEFYIIEDPTGLGKENPHSETSSFRSYAGVLANREIGPPSSTETTAEQTTQEKSPKDEEDYWEIVVEKQSPRPKHDYTSENTAHKKYLPGTGDDYQRCRYKAIQIRDSVKSLKDQAIKARADRKWNDADDLENQATLLEKMAQQADESGCQDMFDLKFVTV